RWDTRSKARRASSAKRRDSDTLNYLLSAARAKSARRQGSPIRMVLTPMTGDIHAAAYPHLVVAFHVVEKAREPGGAPGVPDQTAMHPDRHHLRRGRAFRVEHVEGVLAVREEVVAGAEPGRCAVLGVVSVQAVRHHKVRLAVDYDPVGEIVVV